MNSSNFKTFIKQFIPPILINGFKNLKPILHNQKEFPTYEDALFVCNQNHYENADIVKVVVEKNRIYREKLRLEAKLDFSCVRTGVALVAAQSKGGLNVLDFGGGGGSHYALAKLMLPNAKEIRWHVVETAAMAKEAKKLETEQLKFFDDITKAHHELENTTLVFTSSALQYCPDPLQFLKKLIGLEAPYLFLTRTPLLDDENNVISIQTSHLADNGPGPLPHGFVDRLVTYPITYISRKKVEASLSEKYEIRFKIEEGDGGFHFKNLPISMTGYFCTRRSSPPAQF